MTGSSELLGGDPLLPPIAAVPDVATLQEGPICEDLLAYFVDPGTGDDRAFLGNFFCFSKVFGFDDSVTGDGVFPERKVLGPRVRDFSSTANTPHVDPLVCDRLEPFIPSAHFFLGGFSNP